MVVDYLSQTGMDALKGADILSTAPESYSSTVEYGGDVVGQYMKNIAQVHLAGLRHPRAVHHRPLQQLRHPRRRAAWPTPKLWGKTSNAIADFYDDLKQHNDAPTTSSCWSSPSSGGGSTTTAPAPTTVRAASLSWSASKSRAASTGSTPPWSREAKLLEGDLHLQQRLPQHLRHHPGELDGLGRPAHRERQLREVRLHLTQLAGQRLPRFEQGPGKALGTLHFREVKMTTQTLSVTLAV